MTKFTLTFEPPCTERYARWCWRRVKSPSTRLTGSVPEVFFFLEKRPVQTVKLLHGTHLSAFWLEGFCDGKALPHSPARILRTGGTALDSFFLTALHDMIPAPVFRFAPGAGNFLRGHDMIAVSDFHPELCRMEKYFLRLFVRVFHVSWTCGTVVTACCKDPVLRHSYSPYFRGSILQYPDVSLLPVRGRGQTL